MPLAELKRLYEHKELLMGFLTKEQILAADDLKTEVVQVPEWGGEVHVRTMTGSERDSFEQSIIGDENRADLSNIRARLCALTIVGEQGVRLFDANDITKLGEKSAAALDRVFAVSQRFNGIGTADIEDLTKAEDQS